MNTHKLSEMESILIDSVRVIRDCEYQGFYLVGKPYENKKRYISFITDPKYIERFLEYDIAGVICNAEVAKVLETRYYGGLAISGNPKKAFFQLHNYYSKSMKIKEKTKIHPTATIHHSAIIDEYNVVIGENTTIMANTIIKEGTEIGDDCIIREGCVLGSPAFYYFGEGNEKTLVNSTGKLRICNNVELHTNVIIEKGVMEGSTIIADNTKIDNCCVIGHDTHIGHNVTIAGGSTLAGGVVLGDNCFLGVGVNIAPSISCGKNSKMSTGSVVTKDVPENTQVSGNFAIDHEKYLGFLKRIR